MTKEGAEKVREAVKAIYEQCEATSSCGNCPLCDRKDLSCDDLFECIPNTISGGGLNDSKRRN